MINRKLMLLACAGAGAMAWTTFADAAEADTAAVVDAEAATEVAEVVVAGQRAAQGRAIDQKHRADIVEEVLSADDVGKLPDQNVAEAVRRLPGVSVANDQGEGRYVIIRGVDPNLALVTVNGQTAAAPEPEGRQVKLDDIPSSLMSGLKVIKSLTADLDADSIAGQVDIETLSAFDRPGLIASLHGTLGYYELNHQSPYGIDGVLGSRLGAADQFGALISANYSRRPIRSENVQGTSNWVNGVPDSQGMRFYNLARERSGFVGNFDWRPNDDTRLFLRAMYSEFSDNENRDRFDITNTGVATPSASTSGTYTRVRGDRLVRRRQEDDNTLTVSGGGSFMVGPGKLVAEAVYSRAEKTDPLRSEFAFRSGNVTSPLASYDTTPFLFKITAPTPLFDPSIYAFRSFNLDTRQAVEELTQLRADYQLPLSGLGDNGFIKFGLKYLERDKTNNRDIDNYSLASGQTFLLSNIATPIVGSIYDGRYPMGPRVVYDYARTYVTAHPNVMTRVANTSLSTSLLSDYAAEEKITAGYAMADVKFGSLTVVPGVRVEHTDGTYTTKSYIASTVSRGPDVTGSKTYTDVFPGLNARFDVNEHLVFRGAVTTAIGRPGYTTNNGLAGGVIPTVSVDSTANPPTVVMGNADLKSLRSVNYDAAAEYYFGDHSLISVAAFDKEIDDPIFSQVSVGQNGTFGGVALTNATVTMPVNGRSARIRGLELNALIQFDFFDGPLGGLGFGANVALIDADADGVPAPGAVAVLRDDVPLINQSERVGTVQLFYEKYGVTGRIAYSFRSHYLDGVGATAATDTYTADHGQLDARIAYAFRPEFEIFLEASNLNNAPWRRWIGNDHQMVENEQYKSLVQVGFTLKR